MRNVRSILYVPAHRGDWVADSTTHGADAIVLDLEDSVPADDKSTARRVIVENESTLNETDAVVTVRVNECGSEWFYDDLDVIGPWLDAIVLPKVESPAEVRSVEAVLDFVEHRLDLQERIELVPLLESAAAIFRAQDIAAAGDRVAAIGCGTSKGGDVQQSLGLGWSPEGLETLYVRSKVVLEARTAGVDQILSGIWATIDDEAGLREKARRQKRNGFTGTQVIHPTQAAPVNDVFTPTREGVAYYRELLESFEQRQGDSQGVIEHAGEMVDAATLKTARRVLDRADEFGVDQT